MNADTVFRLLGGIAEFAAVALGLAFAYAVIARVLGPRPDGDEPPGSISSYETALATRMLRRYGVRWVLLCLGLAIAGRTLLRIAE